MTVCPDKAACLIQLIFTVWTTAIISNVAAILDDAAFTPNSKCKLGLQERPLPTPARHESSNEFDVLPENTVCTGTQELVLMCLPRSSGPVYWELQTKTARCQSNGNMTVGNSTLMLPCDSYSVRCIVATQGQLVSSPVIYITKDNEIEEETQYCMEGEFNLASFFCYAPVEEVIRTRWFVGGEECPQKLISSNGLRLDLPCMLKNNQKEVSCEVEFRGGIVNKTVGWIQVNESNFNQQVSQNVNNLNGVTVTESLITTATHEQDTERSIQLSRLELALIIIIIIVIVLAAIIITFFLITRRCMRKSKEEQHENDDETTHF